MRSPFPGMDPFIEGQKWRGFHTLLIAALQETITRRVAPRYVVDVEESLTLQRDDGDEQTRFPDLSITEGDQDDPWDSADGGTATAVVIEPKVYTLPKPQPHRRRYLEVRETNSRRLVTVIEVLSPTNKDDGFREYLGKRAEMLAQPIHLVEIDLLRAGRRLPTVERLHAADYYVFVSRNGQRPKVEVFGWPLAHVLPPIPIPLLPEDPDAIVNLQEVFDLVYDRAGYGYSLDYKTAILPPMSADDAAWSEKLLNSRQPTVTEKLE